MNKIIFTLLIILCAFNCLGQVKDVQKYENDSISQSTLAVDPIIQMPFNVDKRFLHIILPESLGGIKAKGRALLTVFINKNGSFKYLVLNMVNVIRPNKEPIAWDNFSGVSRLQVHYPPVIKKYYYFFEKHIKSLKFTTTGQKAKQINELSLPIQIG